jgi:hypothetical protein
MQYVQCGSVIIVSQAHGAQWPQRQISSQVQLWSLNIETYFLEGIPRDNKHKKALGALNLVSKARPAHRTREGGELALGATHF